MKPADLVGAILLTSARTTRRRYTKGAVLDAAAVADIQHEARTGKIAGPLSVAWADASDVHEDEAARRLAAAVAGGRPGVTPSTPRHSRIDLRADLDGVLRVNTAALAELNALEPLEVFTLFDGQAVEAGQTVAGVKVAPHLVPEEIVVRGEEVAGAVGGVVGLMPYRPLRVTAIAGHPVDATELERFDSAARLRTEALGGIFDGTHNVTAPEPDLAKSEIEHLLAGALERKVSIVLVGGVSAGDPVAPFFEAMEALGGNMIRRGVPTHPGSMIWLAEVGDAIILGLPRCGVFSMATAADLFFPRLMTGERPTAASVAEMGHGGLLQADMRFRLPPYARHLATELDA
ncbi:MAG: hypothetical protein V3T16_10095 [Gemmatimonadales bacterium]